VSVVQWNKGHAYDREMRAAAYAFFARTLRGVPEVGPAEPEGGVATEPLETLNKLDLTAIPQDKNAIVAEFRTRLAAPFGRSAEDVRRSLRALFAREDDAARPTVERMSDVKLSFATARRWVLRVDRDVSLPLLVLSPAAPTPAVAILLHPAGKVALATHQAEVVELLERGVHVVFADVRYTGEWDLGHAWRDLYGRFFGLDEGVLAVRDVRRIVDSLAAIELPASARVAVIGHDFCGANALFAAALDERIVCAAAPKRGSNYRDEMRRPRISRVLLHADLDDVEMVLGGRGMVGAGAAEVVERLR
jgi:hypothetical protein